MQHRVRLGGFGRGRRIIAARRDRLVRPSRALGVLTVLLTATAFSLSVTPKAQAASQSCTPDPGYSQCVQLTYDGADQSYTLPANAIASNVLVKLWGAGGGGIIYQTMNGGSGGYTAGVLDLTANRTVTVIVGGGGKPACATANQNTGSTSGSYGGGGASAPLPPPVSSASSWYCGASGGGRSAVRVGAGIANTSAASEVLTAGGGGGTSDGTGGVDELAGPGGGVTGGAGICTGADTCPGGVGGGGSQSAGGAAGAMGSLSNVNSPVYYNAPSHGGYGLVAALPGTQFQGGTSGSGADSAGYETGGGGGGGYFGGGGGGLNTNPYDAPGGGGSGHVDPIVAAASTVSTASYLPSQMTAAQYLAGVGVGGGTSTQTPSGGNGLVVFQFNVNTPVPSASSGSAQASPPSATAAHQLASTGTPLLASLAAALTLILGGSAALVRRRARTSR